MPCAPPRLLLTLLLPVLLGPSSLGTREPPDVPTESPSPRLNLKFDPRAMRLSWNCLENSTSSRCFLIHKENGKIEHRPRPGDCQCTFRRLSLHGGVTLRVSVAVGQRTLREELLYANPGAEGTAARGFSCVIYRADFMNCSWTQGPAAPSDVQYFLYIGDTERKNETECPHYMQDSGTHRGCHLQDLSALPFNAFFLVNGTSRQAEIQFLDSILSTKEIEQISPPDNVSVACNASHCLVQWDQPRTRAGLSDGDFQYQLGIWRQNAEALSEDPVAPRDLKPVSCTSTCWWSWGPWSAPWSSAASLTGSTGCVVSSPRFLRSKTKSTKTIR
ncbi:granulocyte-macrophage colony-stimulating factor receptor subunit alpha-like isoform X4 [Sciurus carolinensis]|uniref:granulocyte-macrophage colony-stimulating factor receptor subunit alpha-like isoform X4 n=1 Tax=Sciurus carolinensis TaxID=30640 RepID=UPI001FB3ED65|nr:granulocyte-macrophage colony-stimulating factor receptor subunit alpha-like isoform X4 [Sciurus carolinensis]